MGRCVLDEVRRGTGDFRFGLLGASGRALLGLESTDGIDGTAAEHAVSTVHSFRLAIQPVCFNTVGLTTLVFFPVEPQVAFKDALSRRSLLVHRGAFRHKNIVETDGACG
jgi:hypothetical protein